MAQELEPELLEHLRVEFGSHGCRAAELLSDAHVYLVSGAPAFRLREVVAHCLREAMKEILASVESGKVSRWRSVSREVVDARRRYGSAVGLPEQDAEGALRELLASIDSMSRFHEEGEGVHEKRLIAVLMHRTGTAPLSAGTEPVRDYQKLLGRLDSTAHGGKARESAERLWEECSAILRRLFLTPEIRNAELERLAQVEQPTEAEVQAVLGIVSSPGHLQHFLGKVESPVWLEALGAVDVLDPPDTDGPWPSHTAVFRLSERYPAEVTAWLKGMYLSHKAKPTAAAHISRAAVSAGGPLLSLVLGIVKDHPEHPAIVMSALRAAEQADASSDLVEQLADVILNPSSWNAVPFAESLLKQLSAGVNGDNYRRRIGVLVYKIRSFPENDLLMWKLEYAHSGSIADIRKSSRDDRAQSLLVCLLCLLESAWEWASAGDLLAVLGKLPDTGLRQRFRAWMLANAPDAEAGLIVDEIGHAIASRAPTGDDLPLLERADADCDLSACEARWGEALGAAPDVEQAGRAVTSGDMPDDWCRALRWVPLLPAGAVGNWAAACETLEAEHGRTSREDLARYQPDIAQVAVSPISAEELRSMDPDSVVAHVSQWRPGPADWLGGAREIARALESIVKENIQDWTSNPIRKVKGLRHPTYISRYLHALASAASEHQLPVGDLIDVIRLVRSRPWDVEKLADHPNDYDTDWRLTERSTVDLIRALADSEQGFAGRSDEAWEVLASEASDRAEPSSILSISTGPDYLASAINRPCTNALQVVLSFVAYEHRSSGAVRPEAVSLFDDGLRLSGIDGVEHRAVLVSNIGFLLHVLPEWTEANRELLFGSQAPDGLGQLSVELAIQWSQPNPWLLENFPEAVRRAVGSDTERADTERPMQHMVIAMLWGCSGYSVRETVEFLKDSPELVSKSGHALGCVLDDAESDQSLVEVAADFWRTVLDTETGPAVEGFGFLAEVAAMDAATWEELTLRTIRATDGKIGWSHGIVKRLEAAHPTATGLDLLNELVRGKLDAWESRYIAERAAAILSRAGDLRETNEYTRLHTALLERGVIKD